MFRFLPAPIKGLLNGLLLALNVLVVSAILFVLSLFKLLLPFRSIRIPLDHVILALVGGWVAGNRLWMRHTLATKWDVTGVDKLDLRGWYLVNSNHQSWVDIFVLQGVLHKKVPFLKFFLKQELIWVPVIGLSWWALDFPFMRRHSEAYLKKHPEMRGKDQETTRKACEKFALVPTSVMNFLEGTRFTPAKRDKQQSPYKHLLKPKAGGIAQAMNAMGDKFQAFLNVTIVYPDGIPTFWDFLCGRVSRIIVRVQSMPVPRQLCQGNYADDPVFRAQFQEWVRGLWAEKDAQIDALLAQSRADRHG